MTEPETEPARGMRPEPGQVETAKSIPPWERRPWRAIHRWGVQNPKWYYITPPSLLAVAIYVLSVMPVEGSGGLMERLPWLRGLIDIPGIDKLGHASAYGLLSLLILRGWQREKMPPIGLHGFTLLMCAVFGMMLEIQQGLVGRHFDMLDELANVTGAFMGQVIWHTLMLKWGKRTRLYPGLIRPKTPPPPATRAPRDSSTSPRGDSPKPKSGGDGPVS